MLGRLGGDEFAALLPDTTGGQASAAIDRLRARACEHCPPGADYELSFSAGTASLDGDHDVDLDKLLRQADAVMYEEKRSRHDSRC